MSSVESAHEQRIVPSDSWGMLQRVYGRRRILLWPGQFAMIDLFKLITVLCVAGSICSLLWRILKALPM